MRHKSSADTHTACSAVEVGDDNVTAQRQM